MTDKMMQICHAAIRLHHAEVGEYTEMMAKMIFEVGQRQLSADEKESDASKKRNFLTLWRISASLVREGEMGRRRLRLSMVRVRRISRFCCETS